MKTIHNESDARTAVSAADAGAALERLFQVALLIAEGTDRGLAERGLTRARAEVLWRLHQQGPMNQRALAEMLRCTPRNVTGLLDALQAAGLVARDRHPSDRRATMVSLTESGAAAAARMDRERRQAARGLFGDLPAADLSGFVATLDRLLERLGDGARG